MVRAFARAIFRDVGAGSKAAVPTGCSHVVFHRCMIGQMAKPVVGIVMGSESDLPTMSAAEDVLKSFRVPYELEIVSAHRTPDRMRAYASSARKRGLKVVIAGAGGAAHLPGMVASWTTLPVIGVPVKTKALEGFDSLLSILQMPRGVPVACVAIDNAANAGLLAVRILGASNAALGKRLEEFSKGQAASVVKKNKEVARKG